MKKYLNVLVLAGGGVFLAPFAHAGEDTISKVSAAKSSFVLSNGEGLANVNQLHASAADFRSGTLSKPKKLMSLHYEVASYPQASSDLVRLCYFEPYRSSPSKCLEFPGGASGTTQLFNDFRFDAGVYVEIQHHLKGVPGTNLQSSGKERVAWKYSF